MDEENARRNRLFSTRPSTLESDSVVMAVSRQILEAIHDGRLQPGQRVFDASLATQLGVPRSAVREALQRLSGMGIVESSPDRVARIAVITPRQTADSIIVWAALYIAVIDEVVPEAPDSALTAMRESNKAFRRAVVDLNLQQIAKANFDFFAQLPLSSANQALRRATIAAMHIVRFGSLHLPDYLDFNALDRAQVFLLNAAEKKDLELAHQAIDITRGIEVPLIELPD